MKKIVFGSVAALCAVAGLFSFKPCYFADRYFFTQNAGHNKTGLVGFKNADVTFLVSGSVSPSGPTQCTGSGVDCVISFTINQVTSTNQTKLRTNALLSQTPKTIIYTRSAN